MLGWLTAFWSKIIKFPFVLRYQMRGKGKKVFHLLRHMRFLIYEKIPQEVLKEHKVTQALKDQQKLGKDAKKVVKAEYDLAFDAQIEEAISLKELQQIENRILEHERLHGPIGYEEEFGRKIATILEKAHGEDKKVYLGYLEPIIKVAERSSDYRTLMGQIRTLGPSQLHALSALALRLEIRTASKELRHIKRDKNKIQDALYTWDRVKNNKQLAELHLKTAMAEIEKDIEAELHNDTLIAKRDFLLTLLTLQYFDENEIEMQNYYHKHLMPQIPETERIKSLEEAKKELADHAHVLAQGLRRILHAEENAKKMAQEIEVRGHARKAAA